MIIGFPKEQLHTELRCSLLPEIVAKYLKLSKNIKLLFESDIAEQLQFSNQSFIESGAQLATREQIFQQADIIITVGKPLASELASAKLNSVNISFLDPFNSKDLLEVANSRQISAISVEMVPRTTLAQKMDAMSSQANLAGYAAVLQAAELSTKSLPMMVTAAGTIKPAMVFVIGVGVAGLQAIATAKRLGAKVEAFDTRPATAEQVHSLGAKFVKIDLGETGQTASGYAKELSAEQIDKQRQEMTKVCARADIIITTAQVFGRKAPLLITKEMLAGIRPGTVIIDMAVNSGGNVALSDAKQHIWHNGIRIVGNSNLPNSVALNASQMYASNVFNLIAHCIKAENDHWSLDFENEILKGCTVTHQGKIVHPQLSSV